MATLRTAETERRYRERRTQADWQAMCPMCAEVPTATFRYWKIIPNAFPYDSIAEKHDMLVLLRHVHGSEMTPEEETELKLLKATTLSSIYDFYFETTTRTMSLPKHFHLHLIVLKGCE